GSRSRRTQPGRGVCRAPPGNARWLAGARRRARPARALLRHRTLPQRHPPRARGRCGDRRPDRRRSHGAAAARTGPAPDALDVLSAAPAEPLEYRCWVRDRRLPLVARWRVRLKRRHVFWKTDPRVLVVGPDRLLWLGEARIRECADSDADEVRHSRRLPIHIRSTSTAEMEPHGKAARGPALEYSRRATLDAHAPALVKDRDAECATRPTLAFKAVTHGDPPRITRTCEFELPAMAASRARLHWHVNSWTIRLHLRSHGESIRPVRLAGWSRWAARGMVTRT